jgi:dTMP kinase
MNKKAIYIVLEGVEGVGKTTQTQLLADFLKSRGFNVLQTKEPGTPLIPLTMTLRQIMLDNQYDDVLTRPAREYISQAIRSIHLEQLVVPAMSEYDYIIQDRGILSGYAYGTACGNAFNDLYSLACQNVDSASHYLDSLPVQPERIYDVVVYLRGDALKGLQKAKQAKQEFIAGDAMESRGNTFISDVSRSMNRMSSRFNTVTIDVDGKSIDEVHNEILTNLGLGK